MDTNILITLAIGLIVFYVCYLIFEHWNRSIPGPFRLPIIGTLYCHGIRPEDFLKLEKKYGDVCSIYLGPNHFILLSGNKVIRESGKSRVFINRGFSDSFTVRQMNPEHKGLALLDLTKEVEHSRRTCIKTMRDLGVGRASMEDKIRYEAEELVGVLSNYENKIVNIKHDIALTTANLILYILFNVRYDHDDKKLLDLMKHVYSHSIAFKQCSVIDSLPALRFIPPFKGYLKDLINGGYTLMNFVWEHTLPFLDSDSPKQDACFVRNYIDNSEVLDEEQHRQFFKDLLFGGFETTSATLMWMIVYLANRPDIQTKVQSEIDLVIGDRTHIQVSDKDELPYTQATIAEVQRLCCVGAMMFYQSTNQPSTLDNGKYHIRPNTRGILNYYSIHMSKDMWGDPEVFRPERFMDDEDRYERKQDFTPYGIGKRDCVGEALAKQSLVIFAVRLLQQFRFERPSKELFGESGTDAIIRTPEDFKVKIISRKK